MTESTFHILMVDDVTRHQKLYEFAIKDAMDASVSFATNGLEALIALQDANKYSLLILDLNMPKLGGEETLKQIRQDVNLDNLPVIILTGDSDDETQQRLLELGADDFIEKGTPPELFVARLKSQMHYKKSIDKLTSMAMDMDIFAAGVLHDIRNLETNIVSICYIAQMLLDEDPIENKSAIAHEMVSLEAQATRIGSYAHDIIQMVRETQTNTTIEKIDLGAIITWVREILGQPEKQAASLRHTAQKPDPSNETLSIQLERRRIEWIEPTPYKKIAGDWKFLKLAFFNLVQNSIKYSDPSRPTKIEVSQYVSDSSSEKSQSSQNRQNLIVTKIRDHGIGIPKEDLRRVFKPFIRGENATDNPSKESGGFGLGLSLVAKVIGAMGGRVWAELPDTGHGTVICLELPAGDYLDEQNTSITGGTGD